MSILKNDKADHLPLSDISAERELRQCFLDYAMSVIVSRALPDVRDGLKPVQRRIIYAMHTLGYYNEKSYRKSASVVGEVISGYHPHGNESIYQSIVNMVQPFTKRYPLLDGQGNWGSVDGDNAAAMRYTELKMHKLAREMLLDIDKDTVRFAPNYDESREEPSYLPARLPQLLINGSSGIAVGMATSIPPHNLGEIVDACIAILKNPELSEEELFSIVPGPDFPTAGIICGRAGIVKAYRTGHGYVTVRGKVEIEEGQKNTAIIITEIPFQINKADLILKIADLVKNKVIEGITNIRDESDKGGIRVVIEIKRGEIPQVILNLLYKHTQLQETISIILLALSQQRPLLLSLREMLDLFIEHRVDIVTKRSIFDLEKCRQRTHLLEGLLVALNNIDQVISLIRSAETSEYALEALESKLGFSPQQSKAILDMRLARLTGLERGKIEQEREEILQVSARLEKILSDHSTLIQVIIDELSEIKRQYGDERRSVIQGSIEEFTEADLIPNEEVVITLTRKGYIKRVPLSTYSVQHRGGKGKKAIADLDDSDDVMQDVFVALNHDTLLFFTNKGRIYTLTAYEVTECSRTARGRAVVNLLALGAGEQVVKLLSGNDISSHYLVMVTKKGIIKKTPGSVFKKIRVTGVHAITLEEDDELAFCGTSSGEDTIVLATKRGQGIRFKEKEVRPMGRQARGVFGIRLRKKDEVVGMEIISDKRDLLFATEYGYGKRVSIDDFRIAHRSGYGVRTIPVDERNGHVVGVVRVSETSHILLIDQGGKIIRLSPQEVRTMGRQAKGVRLIRLDQDQALSGVVSFDEQEPEKVPAEELLNGADFDENIEADLDGDLELTSDDSSDEETSRDEEYLEEADQQQDDE